MTQEAKQTQHTPGPWTAKGITIDDARSQLVAVVHRPQGVLGGEGPYEANAHLIASAPDLLAERDRLKSINAELLEALQAINARISGEFDHPALVKIGPLDISVEIDCQRIARAAISLSERG